MCLINGKTKHREQSGVSRSECSLQVELFVAGEAASSRHLLSRGRWVRDVGEFLPQRQRSYLLAAPPAAATRECLLALVAWGFTEGVLLLPPSRFLPLFSLPVFFA